MIRLKHYKISSTLIAIITMALVTLACGKTIYVDDDAPVPSVEDRNGGANDGSSWENAYVYLQDALADANDSDKPVEIRVAQGVYKPDMGANQTAGGRNATFQLINGVSLKGGYAGFSDILDPNTRDIKLYETVLSGDLRNDDVIADYPLDLAYVGNKWDNSMHVVTGSGTDGTAVLDGVVIKAGYADSYFGDSGGGMYNSYGSPTVSTCVFEDNFAGSSDLIYGDGAGMFNEYSSPTLINCTFERNCVGFSWGFIGGWSAITGGGLCNYYSDAKLIGCVFKRNVAFRCGGGLSNINSNPELIECVFIDNDTFMAGGAIYGYNSNTNLRNCLITGNIAGEGGGAYFENSNAIFENCTLTGNIGVFDGNAFTCGSPEGESSSFLEFTSCIVWNGQDQIWNSDNSTLVFNYSDVQGGWDGQGNIDEDPLFANPGYWDPNGLQTTEDVEDDIWYDGDYHLKSEAGRWNPNTQTWVMDDVTSPCIDAGDPNSDWSGETWPHGERINMGAYGGTREASMSTQTNGMSLPRVAFIYKYYAAMVDSFKSLLETYGVTVTAFSVFNYEQVSLADYDLIIVADDIIGAEALEDGRFIRAVEDSGRPVVGLGDGGYDFFGLLGLSIGNPYGGHGSRNGVRVVEPGYSLFSTPYTIEIPDDGILQLYTETDHVAIYLWPEVPETITVIGSEPDHAGYYPLVMQHNRYLLWGFDETPQNMTETGKRLFINVVIWTANAGWES